MNDVANDLNLRSIESSAREATSALNGIEGFLDAQSSGALGEITNHLEAISENTARIAAALEEMLRGVKEDAAQGEEAKS